MNKYAMSADKDMLGNRFIVIDLDSGWGHPFVMRIKGQKEYFILQGIDPEDITEDTKIHSIINFAPSDTSYFIYIAGPFHDPRAAVSALRVIESTYHVSES